LGEETCKQIGATPTQSSKGTPANTPGGSETIGTWFKLVEDTKVKYSVHDDDAHNSNKTGFQMGVVGSMKVVIDAGRHTRPELVQPGDREWATVIQSICAAGYATQPFIIYKGRVHISAWYEEANIPRDWKLSVSENGWTNSALGPERLKHFDSHTNIAIIAAIVARKILKYSRLG
jgi:hypothetical protein